MDNGICGFSKKYRFLSNFYTSLVTLDGLEYPSVEHGYQAAKTHDVKERKEIQLAKTASEAKTLGQKVVMREDWEEVKIDVMTNLVRQKFTNDIRLRRRLLDTCDFYLEETNHWGDRYWGVCRGKGENHLGKILMKIRDEL